MSRNIRQRRVLNPTLLERDPKDCGQEIIVLVCDTREDPDRLARSLACLAHQVRRPNRVIVGQRHGPGARNGMFPGFELECSSVDGSWSEWVARRARQAGEARIAVLEAGQFWPVQRLAELARHAVPVVVGPCGHTHAGHGGDANLRARFDETEEGGDPDLCRVRHATLGLWSAAELAARMERSAALGRPRIGVRSRVATSARAAVYMDHRTERTRAELDRLAAAPGLAQFRDRHRGQRAFVVGNGPSLARMDLSPLNDEVTFASNSIFLLFPRSEFRPRYYSCVDGLVLPDRAPDIRTMLAKHPGIQGFFPRTISDHDIPDFRWWVPSIIGHRPNACFFESRFVDLERQPHRAVSLRPWEYLYEGMTVTIVLLQLAVLMGCDPIYLVGCDTEYKVPEGTVTQSEITDRRDRRLISPGADPNHFDPDYFGFGRAWHAPDLDLMLKHYRLLRSTYESRGTRIFNAGLGGKLEVFPRIEFSSLIHAQRRITA